MVVASTVIIYFFYWLLLSSVAFIRLLRYNYSYIGLHIDNVRGLRMLASRDEGLNLFVSLEWAGQVYRTDTVHDWNGDAIDYTIYFQVFCISARPQVSSCLWRFML